jgi:cytochrome c
MKKLIVAVGLALAVLSTARADERATAEDAESLVKNAVAYLKRHGPEKAFKEFQNKNGPFVFKDLYVFVNSIDGKTVVHPTDPERVGMDVSQAKDPDGKLYVQERLEIAKTKGSGWQEYKYRNPATNKVEGKISYIERVGDYVVVAGAYKR